MVFFTCNNCGESLKKNAVTKHSFRCRSAQGVSCIDCHKVFRNDFAKHFSCISEQEKYGGSGFVAKESKNQKKQDQWIERVINAWKNDNLTKNHFNSYFQDPSKWQNIPRNLKKLKNYLVNSLNMRYNLLENFCQVASSVLESMKQENTQETNNSQTTENETKRKNDQEDGDVPAKKLRVDGIEGQLSTVNENEKQADVDSVKECTKKHKKIEKGNNVNKENYNVMDDAEEVENGNALKFKWKSSIKNILKANDSKMKIKKLQKIIVKQYLSHMGDESSVEEAKELFQNKIKNDKFILEDKYIQLK